jgi:hypothetical protein
MRSRTIIFYSLIVLIVVILGALAGWFLFLRSRSGATQALSSALGLGTQAPMGSAGPFGQGGGTAQGAGMRQGSSTPPRLWHVASAPVGGFGFATTSAGTVVRFAERATGYIFEVNAGNGSGERLTNTLMPKVYEALFSSGGRVALRTLASDGSVSSFAGLLRMGTSSELGGAALRADIEALAPDPRSAQFFSMVESASGASGATSNWDGSKQKQMFASAVPGWRASWLPDGRIVLAQKAADSVLGYSYVLNKGAVQPLLGGLPGLIVLPRSGSGALLYSVSQNGALSLYVRASASSTPVRLPIATLADKCVWAPGTLLVAYCGVPQTALPQDFLDRWYRGEIHSQDAVWKVNASAGQAQQVFAPPANTSLDIENPAMDAGGAYLGFMNAGDLSLWVLRLEQ